MDHHSPLSTPNLRPFWGGFPKPQLDCFSLVTYGRGSSSISWVLVEENRWWKAKLVQTHLWQSVVYNFYFFVNFIFSWNISPHVKDPFPFPTSLSGSSWWHHHWMPHKRWFEEILPWWLSWPHTLEIMVVLTPGTGTWDHAFFAAMEIQKDPSKSHKSNIPVERPSKLLWHSIITDWFTKGSW